MIKLHFFVHEEFSATFLNNDVIVHEYLCQILSVINSINDIVIFVFIEKYSCFY